MRHQLLVLLFSAFISGLVVGQKVVVQSPNQKISAALYCQQNTYVGEWYIKASYDSNGKITEAVPRIDLGLLRSDQDFSKGLKFLKAGKPLLIKEEYTALFGKKSVCKNTANEVVLSFENPGRCATTLNRYWE